jgi:ATP-dependent protease ClpP protease subunit
MEKKKSDISREHHTLFTREIPENKRVVNKQKNLFRIYPRHKVFTVFIESFLERKRGLHSVFHELRNAGRNDILEIRINSSGGYIHEGAQFYNLMLERFHKRTYAFLDNHGYSMGALMFCMAHKRIIYPYSDIMFHNYSGGAVGKGEEIKSKILHTDALLIKFFKNIVLDKSFLSEKEFNKMLIGKDYWFDAKQMCERKIATHVIVEGDMMKAKKYLKYLENNES